MYILKITIQRNQAGKRKDDVTTQFVKKCQSNQCLDYLQNYHNMFVISPTRDFYA